MPRPGTDLRNNFDFIAVKPPLRPTAPQRQFASEMRVPYPQLILSWSHTSYCFTLSSTKCLPIKPFITAFTTIRPMTHRLLTNLESWSTTTSSGRQKQKGFSNIRPAKANPVKYWELVELEIAKQRSITFSGSWCSLTQKKKPARASSRVRYFLPGLNFTPYYTIYNFWIVLGSFRRTTFYSNVRGQARAPPVYGFLSRFSMSRLMRSVLMPHLSRLSRMLIIIITCKQHSFRSCSPFSRWEWQKTMIFSLFGQKIIPLLRCPLCGELFLSPPGTRRAGRQQYAMQTTTALSFSVSTTCVSTKNSSVYKNWRKSSRPSQGICVLKTRLSKLF